MALPKVTTIRNSSEFNIPASALADVRISLNNVRFIPGEEYESANESAGVDPERVKLLAGQIAQSGQNEAVTVRQIEDTWEIIEGMHRRGAVLLINASPEDFKKKQQIPLRARVVDVPDLDALVMSFTANDKKTIGPMDRSKVYHLLKVNHEMTDASIAQKLGVKSVGAVGRSRRLQKLPYQMQCMLSERKISEFTCHQFLDVDLTDKQMQKTAVRLKIGELDQAALNVEVDQYKREKSAAKALSEDAPLKPRKRSLEVMRSDLAECNTARARKVLSYMRGQVSKEDMWEVLSDDASVFFEDEEKVEEVRAVEATDQDNESDTGGVEDAKDTKDDTSPEDESSENDSEDGDSDAGDVHYDTVSRGY